MEGLFLNVLGFGLYGELKENKERKTQLLENNVNNDVMKLYYANYIHDVRRNQAKVNKFLM